MLSRRPSWRGACPSIQFVAASNYRDLAAAFAAGLVVIVLSLLVLRTAGPHEEQAGRRRRTRDHGHMLEIGALVVLFTLLPDQHRWAKCPFTDQWDRYTLYASSGVALITGAAAFRFLRNSAANVVLVTWIGMSVVGALLQCRLVPRTSGVGSVICGQQLVWRAPGLGGWHHLFAELPAGRLPGGL